MGKTTSIPEEVIETIKTLVEDYIRGDKTAAEVQDEASVDRRLAPHLKDCLGCNSFPHELLESVGLDPFETDARFRRELTITREGLERNLRLAKGGGLTRNALSDWVTDWFSWQIAERPGDEVVLELAGELMMGEETIESVVESNAWFDFFLWHIRNTDPSLGENVSLGLVVMEHLDKLADDLRQRILDEISEDALRRRLSRIFTDHLESIPTLEDDICEAVAMIGGAAGIYEAIDRFLLCVAKTADPLGCAGSALSSGDA